MFSIFCVIFGLLSLFIGLNSLKKKLTNSKSEQIRAIISKTVSNDYLAFLIGIASTILIQSSSSVTAITIILVSCNVINLSKGLSIVLGSNIGTCFSSFIYALNFDKLPLILFVIGVILLLFKKETIASIIFSLCLIFLGIVFLENGLNLLSSTKLFDTLINNTSHPLLSFVSSSILTALLQSSSVVILLIQNMFSLNIISLQTAICYVLGANVGTCMTGIIASINTSKLSKKVAWFNLYTNLLGGIMFIIILNPFSTFILSITKNISNLKIVVSITHLIYNILSSVVCFMSLELIKHFKIKKNNLF